MSQRPLDLGEEVVRPHVDPWVKAPAQVVAWLETDLDAGGLC